MEIELRQAIRQAKAEIDQLPGENDAGVKLGYKFLERVDHHLERILTTFQHMNPTKGGRVFEIGCGCCYLLHMCRQQGCEVKAVDVQLEYFAVYRTMRRILGLELFVSEFRVEAFRPIPFGALYDRIVATAIVFDYEWGVAEHLYFVEDCLRNMKPGGLLVLSFNEHTVITPPVMAAYGAFATFPEIYMAVVPQSALPIVTKARS